VFKRESDLATLKAVSQGPIGPPSKIRSDVPEELDRIVMKAMNRTPDERYQTAAELAEDLSAFLVERGYVRSEKRLADYLAELFGPQRRQTKLRVSQASIAEDTGAMQKTPSLLRDLPRDLSPVRSESFIPAFSDHGIQAPTVPTGGSLLTRRKRQRRIAVGVFGVLAAGAAALIGGFLYQREPA